MFFRIFIRDMKRKKGIHIILFLFILLAAVFVAGSVNNILVVTNAMQYSMDKGAVPDLFIFASEQAGELHMDEWLDADGGQYVERYLKNEMVSISAENIKSFGKTDRKDLDLKNSIFLQSQWKDTMLIFDQEEKVANIKDGEIGLQASEMSLYKIKAGDQITLRFGDWEKSFRAVEILDPAFGGDYAGMSRYLLSNRDFAAILDQNVSVIAGYSIDSENPAVFSKEMNRQGIRIILSESRSMIASTYMVSMLMSGILIVIGICLILISFLVLRFTILFTLQEDYQEIGIMKAIGIRDGTIKKIYLVKYLVLAVCAISVGFILSIPFSDRMIDQVKGQMMMEGGNSHIGINLLSSFLVLCLCLLFCYLSTNRLKRFSAMEAIRSGQTGERFRKKSALSLQRHRRMLPVCYLAVNDIFSNLRRFLVLIVTYTLGALLIILPLNVMSSLMSDEMAANFLLDPAADFYISSDSIGEGGIGLLPDGKSSEEVARVERVIKESGYNASVATSIIYTLPFYVEDAKEMFQYSSIQTVGNDGSYIQLSEGKTPILENELVMSEQIMKELGLKIGDTVHLKLRQETKSMIVTGTYQNFMQMGKSVFLNSNLDLSGEMALISWYYQGWLKSDQASSGLVEELKENVKEFSILTLKEAVQRQLGSTSDQLKLVKGMILGVISMINLLITVLMTRIFIMEESGQISILKSMGFSAASIRLWQSLRMGAVMALGVLLGVLLSIGLNDLLLRPVFGIMGASHMKIEVNPFEAYLLYPACLLLMTFAAAWASSSRIRKISVMEMNRAE